MIAYRKQWANYFSTNLEDIRRRKDRNRGKRRRNEKEGRKKFIGNMGTC